MTQRKSKYRVGDIIWTLSYLPGLNLDLMGVRKVTVSTILAAVDNEYFVYYGTYNQYARGNWGDYTIELDPDRLFKTRKKAIKYLIDIIERGSDQLEAESVLPKRRYHSDPTKK